jgi:hypothetical protein
MAAAVILDYKAPGVTRKRVSSLPQNLRGLLMSTLRCSYIPGAPRLLVIVIMSFSGLLAQTKSQTNVLIPGLLTTAQGSLIDVTAPAYGATHDGIHDDTSAIQLAVSFAAKSGGLVYLPCGTYLMSSNAGVVIHSPKISVKGQNQGCVVLNYTGAGRALTVQMVPFTTNPAGEFSGFTIIGTPNGSEGILSGQIVSSHWHDIAIAGFMSKSANNGSGGAGLHLHNAGNLATWTERNVFENITLGGMSGNAYNNQDLLMDSDNAADSFGYNRFLDVKCNVTAGTVGINLASGFFYNSVVVATFNMDTLTPGAVGPVAVETSGNWDSNTVVLNGECNTSGPGTGTPYAVQINSGGRFSNLKGSAVTIFSSSGAQIGVNNLNAPSSVPDQTLVEHTDVTGWDTGTFALNGVATSPQAIQRSSYGSHGLLIGNNIESPYVSMFDAAGNAFVIGTVASGGTIGSMRNVADVDTLGRLRSATYTTLCNGLLSGVCTAPSTTDGVVPVNIGGFTSPHRAGLSTTYMQARAGINEEMSGDPNFLGGIGYFLGTNASHPLIWSSALDSSDFAVYEKSLHTPLAAGNIVFQLTHGGGLGQGSVTRNVAGTCVLSGTNTCMWSFTDANASAPLCVGSPQFVPSALYSVTSTATACVVTFASNQTGTFSFVKVGNPN